MDGKVIRFTFIFINGIIFLFSFIQLLTKEGQSGALTGLLSLSEGPEFNTTLW